MKPDCISRVYFLLPFLLVAGESLLSLEQYKGTHDQWKRNSDSDLSVVGLNGNFVNNLRLTVNELNTSWGTFLIHTGSSVTIVTQGQVKFSSNISATVYENLKTVSHLPVSAVSLLLPELLESGGSLVSSNLSIATRQRLIAFRKFVNGNVSTSIVQTAFSTEEQYTRQRDIINHVLKFVDEVLSNSLTTVNNDRLAVFAKSLASQLEENSADAVMDYLQCLNSAIKDPSSSVLSELVVVLSVEPFSRRGSFLSQYYSRLLNVDTDSERLILLPGSSCNSHISTCITATNLSLLLSASLTQSISQIFSNSKFASVHSSLSEAAADDIICSLLPPCVLLVGFHTTLQKGYIILMIVFGGLAVLFGIVLCCMTHEDRVMASERKAQEVVREIKLDGPNVFTPLSSIREENESTSYQQPSDHSGQETLSQKLLINNSNT